MKKIPSFTVNHLKLKPGIYVSRIDTTPSGDTLTTFDIRLTAPNIEAAVTPQALHSIEHLAATWLRNNPLWKDKVIYWGPMGCCTGCYLILKGELQPLDIAPLMIEMFEWIAGFEGEIPGATPQDCGNYTFNDLSEARRVAKRYVEMTLLRLDDSTTNYPE
ncbi:MAG: S-ribosylhomocysteine lyase [Muribaculaceae bacterium]|nr:S-ribosylhomocysteine lyase [Muribaculaceae bacterium]